MLTRRSPFAVPAAEQGWIDTVTALAQDFAVTVADDDRDGEGGDVVLVLRQVELAARRLAARLLDLLHDLLHRRHGARGQHDLGALGREVARGALAEA